MNRKTVVYIGNGLGGQVERKLRSAGHDVTSLKDIKQLEPLSVMDLIIVDDVIEKCIEGGHVKCTMDDVVVLRNRDFSGTLLLIYSDDKSVSQYYTNRGYRVLPKSKDHENLVAAVNDLLK